MSDLDAATVGQMIDLSIRANQDNDSRSRQSVEGRLGPSDIGFCRQKAALVLRKVPQSDSKPMWAAACGTAIGDYVEQFLKVTYPEWTIGSVDHVRVTATLPNGNTLSGTPDIIAPDLNAILDLKTVDGTTWVRRNGSSISHKFQRHLYALGAMQAGLLDNSKPIYVGNVYLDRSGSEPESYVTLEEFDPALTSEIQEWYTDVTYANEHGEDAMRDIAPEVCEKICEFYTVCRGGFLPDTESPEVISDPEIIDAANMYDEARQMEKEAKRMKDAAVKILGGHNGAVGRWQLRWTEVAPSDIPGYTRNGYSKISVTKRRGA